jgi:uncharacterized protein involved in type VI secretion and phage assembly
VIVLVGIVTRIDDDRNLSRVKVKFPQLDANLESHWCRLVSTGGGKERGIQFLPEVNDEVLVVGPHMTDLFVVGGLWSAVDMPPLPNNQAADSRDVKKRVIKSRTGHVILLDDGDQPGITIVDSTEKNKVQIDTKSNSLTAEVQGDITLKATGSIKLQATSNIDIEATGSLNAKATGTATLEATGSATVKSSGALSLEGGANASLKAATVSLG